MPKDEWQPIPLSLTGLLDTRSRPADLSPGTFRYKLNLAVNRSGKLCRRAGFGELDFGQRSDSEELANWDFHRRGHAREAPTLQFQSVSPDGVRRLFAGTQSTLAYLDNDTSEWTEIASGYGAAGTRFKAAGLRDRVVFTNNQDNILIHTLGSSSVATIPELVTLGVTKAKVILEFNGVIILMNTVEGGERFSSRVRWCDRNNAEAWDPSTIDTLANFQDLAYGDEILNAEILGDSVYIYTTTSIRRMIVRVTEDTIFAFSIRYSEPKNKTGCLAFENSLVSDGKAHYWFGRDSAYTINQYLEAPKSEEWLLKATGRVYEGPERIDPRCCQSAVGAYNPATKEIWFSYAQLSAASDDEVTCLNNHTIVFCNDDELSVPIKTADFVNRGFTSFVNFSRSVSESGTCNASSVFIGASADDYCLKNIGSIFQHRLVDLIDADPVNDIPDDSYTITGYGYKSQIVGLIPAGYPQNEKLIREVMLDHETVEDPEPNYGRLRIGNSFHLADPVSTAANCGVLWSENLDEAIECPDGATLEQMKDAKQRPDIGTQWAVYYQGRFLYFELTVITQAGGDPTGCDSAWNSITFDVTKI